jgi:hypothetical protein
MGEKSEWCPFEPFHIPFDQVPSRAVAVIQSCLCWKWINRRGLRTVRLGFDGKQLTMCTQRELKDWILSLSGRAELSNTKIGGIESGFTGCFEGRVHYKLELRQPGITLRRITSQTPVDHSADVFSNVSEMQRGYMKMSELILISRRSSERLDWKIFFIAKLRS